LRQRPAAADPTPAGCEREVHEVRPESNRRREGHVRPAPGRAPLQEGRAGFAGTAVKAAVWAAFQGKQGMYFKAGFYATRLPFDPGSPNPASYVEGLWSPAPARLRENRRQKPLLFQQRLSCTRSVAGPFSLRRGLESVQLFFNLRITWFLCRWIWLRNDEGDPLGRPRSSPYAARGLARTPLGEGGGIGVPTLANRRVSARRDPRGQGRFGEERHGVSRCLHGCPSCMPWRRIEQTSDVGKGYPELLRAKSQNGLRNAAGNLFRSESDY
jgi:hypothetical protein